ncbi:MAG: hypothetical protein ACE5FS_16435 [Paracoccaceae bacterium]
MATNDLKKRKSAPRPDKPRVSRDGVSGEGVTPRKTSKISANVLKDSAERQRAALVRLANR